MSAASSPSPGGWLSFRLGPAVPIAGLVIGLVGLISFPLPSAVLDTLVAINLLSGVLLLLSVLYIRSIVEFSTFSILLLITTIFRLATSVSTTRAILSGGDPGDVIRTFGELVVGGSVAVGLVIFLIVAIIQFVVITKGAERIAEVAARFNLDAMPGRQMSIEADIRAGAISQEQAGKLRETLRAESQIVGSLDGSMKFVKGDSIASFVIVFVNLIGGLAVGVGVMQMSFASAGRLFSILTIGDGLVAQIPSILSAVAAGVFVSRAGSESRQNVVSQAAGELASNRIVFGIIAGLLLVGGLVPGMPIFVFWTLAALIAGSLGFAHYRTPASASAVEAPSVVKPLDLGKYSDPYLCRVSPDTLKRLNELDFNSVLTEETRKHVKRVGIGLPLLLFEADDSVSPGKLRLIFEGVTEKEVSVPEDEDLKALASRVLAALVKRFVANFGAQDTTYYLQQVEAMYPYIKDLVQAWPAGLLDRMFQRMLFDGLSIAHPRPIVRSIEEALAVDVSDEDEIYARLRLALSERISEAVTAATSGGALKELSGELVALAGRASSLAGELSGIVDKEDAYGELVVQIRSAASVMEDQFFVVPDEIRNTCADAARKAKVGCVFFGSAEVAGIDGAAPR